jgi:uncharacterized membrane protein YozB (DUF420 family)
MEALADTLAAVNAGLNGTSATLLFVGWRFAKAGNRSRHKFCMLSAVGTSALFLVFYLLRMQMTGAHYFHGPGWLKGIYLTILFSHMILAMVLVPLVVRTLYLALRKEFEKHKRVVRYTFPIWLYVSVTGVVIYVMLYHISGTA